MRPSRIFSATDARAVAADRTAAADEAAARRVPVARKSRRETESVVMALSPQHCGTFRTHQIPTAGLLGTARGMACVRRADRLPIPGSVAQHSRELPAEQCACRPRMTGHRLRRVSREGRLSALQPCRICHSPRQRDLLKPASSSHLPSIDISAGPSIAYILEGFSEAFPQITVRIPGESVLGRGGRARRCLLWLR